MAHLAHYREAHPLVFVITHWINLIAMIVLIVTGFCIHFPFWPYFESLARGMHVFFGFVIFLNCVIPHHRRVLREDGADGRHAQAGHRLQDLACRRRITAIRALSGSSTTCS